MIYLEKMFNMRTKNRSIKIIRETEVAQSSEVRNKKIVKTFNFMQKYQRTNFIFTKRLCNQNTLHMRALSDFTLHIKIYVYL